MRSKLTAFLLLELFALAPVITPAALAQAPATQAASHAFTAAEAEAMARHAFDKYAPTGMAFAMIQDASCCSRSASARGARARAT